MVSIPGLGRFPRRGNGNPLGILTWKIPWTEESTGHKGSNTTKHAHGMHLFYFVLGNNLIFIEKLGE